MFPSHQLLPVPAGAEEILLRLPHLQLRALAWGDPQGRPLLALHGWLDNAMTFVRLAPALAAAGYRVVAPDFAGHGYSDWRPAGQTYLLMENCFDIQAAALALGWDRFTLLGHSMGAGVASLLAGAHPQAVEKLVMLDGIGTLTAPEEETAAQLGRALGRWIGHQEKYADSDPLSAFSGKIYSSIQAAAEARMKGVGAVDLEAALQLCQRALQQVDEAHAAGGWFWRSDSRLRHPSPWRLTEAQNLSFMQSIQAETLLVEAEQGLLINRPEIEKRFATIKNAQKAVIAGGHHLHLEASSAGDVITAVLNFLQQE